MHVVIIAVLEYFDANSKTKTYAVCATEYAKTRFPFAVKNIWDLTKFNHFVLLASPKSMYTYNLMSAEESIYTNVLFYNPVRGLC